MVSHYTLIFGIMSRKIPLISLIQFVILQLLIGCSSLGLQKEPEIVDRSFISGEPCSAPCWYKIIPGETNESELIEVLAKLPFIDNTHIQRWDNVGMSNFTEGTLITFSCIQGDESQPCGSIYHENGIVQMISYEVLYQLPLEIVIDKLDPPDHVLFGPYPPHGDGCLVDLEWLHKGIIVRIIDRPKIQLCLDLDQQIAFNPTLQVNRIIYESKLAQIQNPCEKRNCINWPGFLINGE